MTEPFATVEIPEAWLSVLDRLRRHKVEFVVAGSTADAIIEGQPESASLLIVAPAPYRRNLERLSRALAEAGVRLRGKTERETLPLEPHQIVQHPALRWRLSVAGTPIDIIGSAVGDGEFSMRVWRTRPLVLTCGERKLTAEVERQADAITTAA